MTLTVSDGFRWLLLTVVVGAGVVMFTTGKTSTGGLGWVGVWMVPIVPWRKCVLYSSRVACVQIFSPSLF